MGELMGIINSESPVMVLVLHILLHSLGVIMIAAILYLIVFYIKKYAIERWIVKAVTVADAMFEEDDLVEKKIWVMAFLKDNGLTIGMSENMVSTLIEAEFNVREMQKNLLTNSVTVKRKN